MVRSPLCNLKSRCLTIFKNRQDVLDDQDCSRVAEETPTLLSLLGCEDNRWAAQPLAVAPISGINPNVVVVFCFCFLLFRPVSGGWLKSGKPGPVVVSLMSSVVKVRGRNMSG